MAESRCPSRSPRPSRSAEPGPAPDQWSQAWSCSRYHCLSWRTAPCWRRRAAPDAVEAHHLRRAADVRPRAGDEQRAPGTRARREAVRTRLSYHVRRCDDGSARRERRRREKGQCARAEQRTSHGTAVAVTRRARACRREPSERGRSPARRRRDGERAAGVGRPVATVVHEALRRRCSWTRGAADRRAHGPLTAPAWTEARSRPAPREPCTGPRGRHPRPAGTASSPRGADGLVNGRSASGLTAGDGCQSPRRLGLERDAGDPRATPVSEAGARRRSPARGGSEREPAEPEPGRAEPEHAGGPRAGGT